MNPFAPVLAATAVTPGVVLWTIAVLIVGLVAGFAICWGIGGRREGSAPDAPARRTELPPKRREASTTAMPETKDSPETSPDQSDTAAAEADGHALRTAATDPTDPDQPVAQMISPDGGVPAGVAEEQRESAHAASLSEAPAEAAEAAGAAEAGEEAPADEADADAAKELLAGGGSVKVDDKLGAVYIEAPDNPDALTRIKGVGPVIEGKLHDFGVYRFEQIAAWNEAQIELFGERLDFPGRVERENWVGQARELIETDRA